MSARHVLCLRATLVSTTAVALVRSVATVAIAQAVDDLAAARTYCVSVGGEVRWRAAMWKPTPTLTPGSTWAGKMEVCRFETDDEAGSRIHVDLLTLWSERPSLAAAAYLARPPISKELPPGNPATYHCAGLSGSSQFGSGAGGGGWVGLDDPDDPVVALCVFPDGSAIDDWGIAYHASGTIRGADLATLFRADTSAFPRIFG